MRAVVIDTETTGLDTARGDRIVEIGGVELQNHLPTGKTFHRYCNPEREVHKDAFAIHGLSRDFLADHPTFRESAEELLAFLGPSDPLIAHNASFDLRFLNADLARARLPLIEPERMIDTLALARRKHAGRKNKLDDLCKRYGVDTSKRDKHGALLDAQLLAELYVDLIDARIITMDFELPETEIAIERPAAKQRPKPLPSRVSDEVLVAHDAFVATLAGNVIWKYYDYD